MSFASLIKADVRHVPLADESAGLVLCDPPYNVKFKRGTWKDDLSAQEYRRWILAMMMEAHRVAKPSALFYCFCCYNPSKLAMFKHCGQRAGFTYLQLCGWHAPNYGGGFNAGMPWSLSFEPILLFRKGKRVPMLNEVSGTNSDNIMSFCRPQTNMKKGRNHPCEKPESLWNLIIARSPGDPVLDLCCGAANSATAARRLGCSWIGIDLDYFDTSCTRLQQAVMLIPKIVKQPTLFEEVQRCPNQ